MTNSNNIASLEIGLFGDHERRTQEEEAFYKGISPDTSSATIPTRWAYNKLAAISTVQGLAQFLRENIGEITAGTVLQLDITTDTNFLGRFSTEDLAAALNPYELAEEVRVRVLAV